MRTERPRAPGWVGLLLLAALPAMASGPAGPPPEDPYAAYAAGFYARALEGFVAEQVDHPDDPAALLNVGAARYQLGDREGAAAAFAAAAAAGNPGVRADALYNLGNTAFLEGRLRQAEERFEASLELDPDDADAKFNLELVRREIERRLAEDEAGPASPPDSPGSDGEEGETRPRRPESAPGGASPSGPSGARGEEPGERGDEAAPERPPSEAGAGPGPPADSPEPPNGDGDGIPDAVEGGGSDDPADPADPDADGDGPADGDEELDGAGEPGGPDSSDRAEGAGEGVGAAGGDDSVDGDSVDGDSVDGDDSVDAGRAGAPAGAAMDPAEAERLLRTVQEVRPAHPHPAGRPTRPDEEDW